MMIFVPWQRLFVAGAFNRLAFDFFRGAELDYFLLDLVKVVLVHAKTLHNHGGFVLSCLTELPRNNSEGHAIVFKHVQDAVEDSLVEQMPNQLEGESLHSYTARAFIVVQTLVKRP